MKYFLVVVGVVLIAVGIAIKDAILLLSGIICVCTGIIVSHFEEIERLIKKDDKDGSESIFFCRDCNEVYSGSSDLDPSDMICPKCGKQTIATGLTKNEWGSFSSRKKTNCKKRWSK